MTLSRPGKGRDPEEQRPDDDGGAGPQEHEQGEQETREEHLRAGARTCPQHGGKADLPAFAQRAALLVESDREERSDDQEACQRREEDVVASEFEQRPDEGDRQHEHADPIGDAARWPVPEIAPAERQPPQALQHRQVALQGGIAGLADARGLAQHPVGLVALVHRSSSLSTPTWRPGSCRSSPPP